MSPMRRERIIQIKRGGVPVDTPQARPAETEVPSPASTVRLIRPAPPPREHPDDQVPPAVPLPRTGTDA